MASKGRNPSTVFDGIWNPRLALQHANEQLFKVTGELVLQGIAKVKISSEWTQAERTALGKHLRSEISRLVRYEKEMRRTCLWEAPYFAENANKREEIMRMIRFVTSCTAKFLELNRANFSDYIAP